MQNELKCDGKIWSPSFNGSWESAYHCNGYLEKIGALPVEKQSLYQCQKCKTIKLI